MFVNAAVIYVLLLVSASGVSFLIYLTPFLALAVSTVYSFRYGFKVFYFLCVLVLCVPLVFILPAIPFAVKNILVSTAATFIGSKLGGYIHSREFWS